MPITNVKKLLTAVLLILLALAIVIVVRTMSVEPPKPTGNAQKVKFQPDAAVAADHLASAIKYRTISHDNVKPDAAEFLGFQAFLERSYPAVHSALSRTIINQYSMLYHWQGSEPQLNPLLLLAHYDVVPANNSDQWQHPPFAGEIKEGYIWGRGTLDDKGSLISIMEAIDALVREGYQPQRSIYLAFGHDEEVSGKNGAMQIAQHLQDKKLRFDFILDEGGMIAVDMIPNFDYAIAAIGPAEKGYLTLELTSETAGGHSSMPPKRTAIGHLASAIHQLEENPFPIDRHLSQALYNEILPQMPFSMKALFANTWLFNPLIDWAISNNPPLNAGVRTTVAATMIQGGEKENVLADSAKATINIRILPGDSIDSVIERITDIIDDSTIKIERAGTANEPSAVTDINGSAYALIRKTIHQVGNKQDIIVAPRLVVAATDARHYSELSNQVLRFIYLPVTPQTISGIHGVNERIAIKDLPQTIRFYYQLIRNADRQR